VEAIEVGSSAHGRDRTDCESNLGLNCRCARGENARNEEKAKKGRNWILIDGILSSPQDRSENVGLIGLRCNFTIHITSPVPAVNRTRSNSAPQTSLACYSAHLIVDFSRGSWWHLCSCVTAPIDQPRNHPSGAAMLQSSLRYCLRPPGPCLTRKGPKSLSKEPGLQVITSVLTCSCSGRNPLLSNSAIAM
jgi:hypothetical protein